MKKIIAPIIITTVFVLYFALYLGVLIWTISQIWIKLLLALVPLAFAAVMIFACIQRIKEIRSGVEDDLGKY